MTASSHITSTLFSVWFAIAGAAIGSFLNVVIFRIPRGFMLSLPSRSFCPACKRKLSWAENVPVLSYVFLRGRCRGCGARISPRYPLVELMTALLFVAILRRFGFSWATPYYAAFAAALVAVTFIDLDFTIIPDRISFPGIAFGLVFSGLVGWLGFFASIEGILLGGGLFWAMAWAYEKIRHREGLGFGDVKLLAMIGAFLGPQGVLITIVISSLVGSMVGIALMVLQRKDLKLAIPFGPFLAIGALVTLFWGDYLIVRFYPHLYSV